jgi:serine/threonine protein kinase
VPGASLALKGAALADIFVSYSTKDTAQSEVIVAFLRQRGFEVAIDRDFVRAGDLYRVRIKEELDRAKVVIVLWSRSSVQRDFVLDEASRARRTVLLPLIIDDLSQTELPLGFGELQAHRCNWQPDGRLAPGSCEHLLEALQRHLSAVAPLDKAIDELKKDVDRRLGAECSVQERLGTGRMSVVFRARHRVYGVVALKVTPLTGIMLLPGLYAEFLGNIEVTRKLSHPNISAIREVRLLETIACTVFDYVEGESLAQIIARQRSRLTLGCIKDIAKDIVEALVEAHTHRIVHCALSPSNILIEKGSSKALVRDFGVPNLSAGVEGNAARALFLDARYMSPEQCLGQPATPHSDQYALGAILYEMLTGRPPFVERSTFLVMQGHCQQAPTPVTELRPHCPLAVAKTVARLLSKKPSDRYFTTRSLLQEIESWPLAESRRLDPIHPQSSLAQSAKDALDSYNRCLTNPDFLPTFYQRLQRDAAVAEKLGSMMFDSQIERIKPAIRHLLEHAQGQVDARAAVERLGARHASYGLDDGHLRTFIETLIDVAVELDGQQHPGQAEALRAAWQAATAESLRCFARAAAVAEPSAPRLSAVVSSPDRQAAERQAADLPATSAAS